MRGARAGVAGAVLVAVLALTVPAGAGGAGGGKPGGSDPASYWTPARMAAATPRDLVVDARGLGYLKRADGSLQPHGHSTGQLWAEAAPARPAPTAKPGGGGGGGGSGDATGPSITNLDPSGKTVGASYPFRATVKDPSGVKSVSFTIRAPSGATQTFAAARISGDVWGVTISGLTDGSWSWKVVAKDGVRKGNTTTSPSTGFTVSTGGGSGDGTVTNAAWTGGGTVQQAAGRIYFQMPADKAQTSWIGYVCSGTVAEDATSGRSVIITAAHCVYDDANKAFARNVLFIPNQDGTTGGGTDLDCSNDPMGCWAPSFGVVDTDWTTRTFPDNIPWDYAYYVVPDTGAHTGTAASSDALDAAAGDLAVQFTAPTIGTTAAALGYSYSEDPNFMYCSEALASERSYGDWWLGHCGLSGGASGGPWLQPVSNGEGPIISVNSWGYTNQPGMAGPRLSGTSASCVFGVAKSQSFATVTNRGVATC